MSLDQPDAATDPDVDLLREKRIERLNACAPRLLIACKAAEDLLTRCEVDLHPDIRAMQATDCEWDAVHATLRLVIAQAETET